MLEANPQSPRWSGLLMAGGKSRRMGRDKAMLILNGEPLWKRQCRTLREAGVGEVMISRGGNEWVEAGENPGDAWLQPGEIREKGSVIVAIPDAVQGCGPLGGLVAGLRRMRGEWLLVLAVDLPLMTADYLREIDEQAERGRRGVVPIREGRYEPLAAVYGKACLPLAEQALAAGEWSMQDFVRRGAEASLLQEVEVRRVENEYFRNANTPEEWEAIEQLIS